MNYCIYCDESRQTKDRFMILAGLIIKENFISKFNELVNQFRIENKMNTELKWTKISNGKINVYKKFIDIFFIMNNTNNVNFHSIILDNHKIDHEKYNNNDKETGFYKFYYQLLLHCFGTKYYEQNVKYKTYLDKRKTIYKLDKLKEVLNNGFQKKKNYEIIKDPFVCIQPLDSKKYSIIQIVDILAGAIGYYKNDYYNLPNSCKGKNIIVDYIMEKSGLNNLSYNTSYYNKRFTIWNFLLR